MPGGTDDPAVGRKLSRGSKTLLCRVRHVYGLGSFQIHPNRSTAMTTMDDFFTAHPDAKDRLIRAAVACARAHGRNIGEYKRLTFERRGDLFSILGDGTRIVSLDASA